MNNNLLNRFGRAALLALIAALGAFAVEAAGLLPELSGFNTIIVSTLIGAVSLIVERLRDFVNKNEGLQQFSIEEVSLAMRLLRALAVSIVGGLTVLLSDVSGFIPDLSGVMQVLAGLVVGALSLGIEYLRDLLELPSLDG